MTVTNAKRYIETAERHQVQTIYSYTVPTVMVLYLNIGEKETEKIALTMKRADVPLYSEW